VTIYVVTDGEYSSYHIEAIFSTEKAARAFVKRYDVPENYDSMQIEEYEIDEPLPDRDKFTVNMHRNGNEARVRGPMHDTDECPNRGLWTNDYTHKDNKLVVSKRFIATVFARDKEQAIKITNELRRQSIAEGGLPK